ncbi:hypothetical protein [Streptomyces malaysiensis]|uniref:hypothetical protein n=1 Tax=Streptomyces malaysiensis TaxID=92644 RepID=UPI0036BBE99F
MPMFIRSTAVTQTMRTVCGCGEGVEVEYVPDDSLASALGLTSVPRASDARFALGVWESAHECAPTVEELLSLIGLDF